MLLFSNYLASCAVFRGRGVGLGGTQDDIPEKRWPFRGSGSAHCWVLRRHLWGVFSGCSWPGPSNAFVSVGFVFLWGWVWWWLWWVGVWWWVECWIVDASIFDLL